MQSKRQLDGAEVGTKVSGVVGDGGDDEVTDLAGQFVEFVVGEVPQVGRLAGDALQVHA